MLSEAFTRLALVHPKEFMACAENSLTMPSIRSRNSKYTADSEAISNAINLGKNLILPDISDNRSRAGAACHLIVAKILESIEFWRNYYCREKQTLERLKTFSETAKRYEHTSLDEYLKNHLYPDSYELMMKCSILPEWPEGSDLWWNEGVLPMVRKEFSELEKQPNKNLMLWQELSKGGERDTINDKRRYMEKLCRNKFTQALKIAHR